MLDNLISDIHKVILDPAKKATPKFIKEFKNDVGKAVEDWFSGREDEAPTLRMSNIGRPDRLLWFEMNRPVKEANSAQTRLRFLMGHLLEAALIYLIKEAGYKVTDQQKEIEIDGVKGHLDAKVNGIPLDAKTASAYAFTKKFSSIEALCENDDYGYIPQLSAYMDAEAAPHGYFLGINKNTSEVALLLLDEWNKIDSRKRIVKVKEIVKQESPPKELCYQPITEDNGNKRLDKRCEWCPYKDNKEFPCFPGLRAFQYSNEVRYYAEVVKKPRVEEISL